jgi:hypothetical protein
MPHPAAHDLDQGLRPAIPASFADGTWLSAMAIRGGGVRSVLTFALLALLAAIALLVAMRQRDHRADRAEMIRLRASLRGFRMT